MTREQRKQFTSIYADARLFKPDPFSNLVVGIQSVGPEQWCILDADGGGACGREADFFSRGPFNFMMSGGTPSNTSDQFISIAGLAADGVARLEIFLADGAR